VGGSDKHNQFFRFRSAIELNDSQTKEEYWIAKSLQYIDVSRQVLLIEGLRIAQATFGGVGITELMNMDFSDYELIVEELMKKNASREG
jgi:hypothetical protein